MVARVAIARPPPMFGGAAVSWVVGPWVPLPLLAPRAVWVAIVAPALIAVPVSITPPFVEV